MIAAEGEQKASRALREASATIAESSSALQLRYLQVPAFLRQLEPIGMSVLYSALFHPTPFNFNCIVAFWDRTLDWQDCINSFAGPHSTLNFVLAILVDEI